MNAIRLCSLIAATAALALAQNQHGEWTLGPCDTPGKIHFSLQSADDHRSFNSSSDWNISDLHGLDLSIAGKHDVHFTIARDAGSIEAEGFAKDGEGAGLYTFQANPQYIHQMETLGFPGITPEQQLAFALHDVSFSYAREMTSLGIQGLDAHKLLACRIFHVDAAFVKELHDAGINVVEAGKLIAFRIHKVTPQYIADLRAHGMHNLTADQLIALRIHGIE